MSHPSSCRSTATNQHSNTTPFPEGEIVAGITYYQNRPITAEQYCALLEETSLGERRPLAERERIAAMLEHADVLVSAWQGERLVGVARSVTDFFYCCYLADLAVSERVQACGIGRELIRQTFHCLQPGCKVILLAAPQAVDYYPKIGFTRHNSAWLMEDVSALH
nr:GNAT family N-acetyltransferase [Plesiomonas shigelloides]